MGFTENNSVIESTMFRFISLKAKNNKDGQQKSAILAYHPSCSPQLLPGRHAIYSCKDMFISLTEITGK